MRKLNKNAYVTRHTIEGFAKRCDCLCGNCPCKGPDKWHLFDQISKNTSSNYSRGQKKK